MTEKEKTIQYFKERISKHHKDEKFTYVRTSAPPITRVRKAEEGYCYATYMTTAKCTACEVFTCNYNQNQNEKPSTKLWIAARS